MNEYWLIIYVIIGSVYAFVTVLEFKGKNPNALISGSDFILLMFFWPGHILYRIILRMIK